MARATSPAVDPNGSPITLMACLIASVIFAICSSSVIECLLSVACRLSLICHRAGQDQHGWTGGTRFYGCPSAETGEGAGAEAARGDAGLAASFSQPSFFGLVVLSQLLSAVVCLSLSE